VNSHGPDGGRLEAHEGWDLVICDLDGTLVDSTPSVVAALVSTLDQLGATVPAHIDLSWCAGPPLHESLGRLLGSEDRLDEAMVAYRLHYRSQAWRLTRPIAGVEAAVRRWRDADIELAVCTYKPTPVAIEVLIQGDLAEHFSLVVGTDLRTDDRRTKTDLLEETLERSCARRERTLYIGDHELDATAAASSGLAFARAGTHGSSWPRLAAKVLTGRVATF
jgi:phosphoglycolate phosphatase